MSRHRDWNINAKVYDRLFYQAQECDISLMKLLAI